MTNFDFRIQHLTVDSLLHLEEEIMDCVKCYCRLFWDLSEEMIPCIETRRTWLMMESGRREKQ